MSGSNSGMADFEIVEEGFDGSGEEVVIGCDSPKDSLISIFNNIKTLHLIADTEDSKSLDPRSVLLDIVEEFSNLEHGKEWLMRKGITVSVISAQ